jgi:hypothetical protein
MIKCGVVFSSKPRHPLSDPPFALVSGGGLTSMSPSNKTCTSKYGWMANVNGEFSGGRAKLSRSQGLLSFHPIS